MASRSPAIIRPFLIPSLYRPGLGTSGTTIPTRMEARREPEMRKAPIPPAPHQREDHEERLEDDVAGHEPAIASTVTSVSRPDGPSIPVDSRCISSDSLRAGAGDLHQPAAPRYRGQFRLDGRPPGSMAEDDATRSVWQTGATTASRNRTTRRTRRRSRQQPAPMRTRTSENSASPDAGHRSAHPFFSPVTSPASVRAARRSPPGSARGG